MPLAAGSLWRSLWTPSCSTWRRWDTKCCRKARRERAPPSTASWAAGWEAWWCQSDAGVGQHKHSFKGFLWLLADVALFTIFNVWFMQLWVCLISTSCLCSSVARSVPLRAVQILRPGAERETPPHAALPWMVCPGQLCMFILFIRNSPFACLCLKASASFFNLQGKRKRKQSQQISGSTSRSGFFFISVTDSPVIFINIGHDDIWRILELMWVNICQKFKKCNTQKYKNKIEQCFISLLNNKCIYFISVCSDMEFYGNILTCLHWDFFNVQILILSGKLSVLYI